MTSLDPKALRTAFGRFMTGVTVVTTRSDQGEPLGFTANSFSSVSLDPPLLLVCPGKFLSSYDSFATCTYFAVSVLAEGQEDVSNTFASFKGDRFAKVAHQLDHNNVPVIEGAVAQFSCKTWQSIPAGDHQILIGQVQRFAQSDRAGLGYAGGQYFSLGLERAALEPHEGQAICGAIIACGDSVLLEQTDQGMRPPQTTLLERGELRQTLQKALTDAGISAHLGAAYSVFDAGKTHQVYVLAQADNLPDTDKLRPVQISDLPGQQYTTPAIAQMMARYARESRSQSFGLYLGDALQGDIHTQPNRS
jgi:flavin reductase (DIM6/NTAB) family NADH-FMN oxidoreductase RutF